MTDKHSSLARLPSAQAVLEVALAATEAQPFSHEALTASVRDRIEAQRELILAGHPIDPIDICPNTLAEKAIEALVEADRPRLRKVINASGVILHTNLGRAVLAEVAAKAAFNAGLSAVNLEYDVESGQRGNRDDLVGEHLSQLCGAQAALVVNNNAAAVLLVLNSLAVGRDVIVSRGELVEIGGSFRIPEILEKSGALLREVGTTNRTHGRDYQNVLGPATAAILKVHTSNYRVVGFTTAVDLKELSAIAKQASTILIEDLGAGALIDTSCLGLKREPMPRLSIEAGADIVTFSGDKLLGGPQCGIIVGRRDLIEKIGRNPLRRALRVDKMTLAALEATLRLYRFASDPVAQVPTLAALARTPTELDGLALRCRKVLLESLADDFSVEIVAADVEVGSGSQPAHPLASVALAVSSTELSCDQLARRFRQSRTPIIGRIERDQFLLDLRLIDDPNQLVPSWATSQQG